VYCSDDGWALVTGCTSGIGEAFADVLAKRGFNILLVSRSEAKLKEVAANLKAKYPSIKTAHVVSDAGSADPANITAVVAAAERLKLKILINNVGVGTELPVLYENTPVADIEHMINVNIRYATLLTQRLIPIMKRHGRGAIVNVSSTSAFLHPPYLAVYGATKSYNLGFSNAIRDELASADVPIEVLALTPGFVVTALTKIPRATLEVCSAEACATAGVNAIGLRNHCGYWYHQVFNRVCLWMPAAIRGPMSVKFMKGMLKKALRNKEKAALAKKAE
jgi:17beta-estradiol 17-dehydrogenase / very-long-chain 3-oxoacyl-CoA reductase